MATREEALRKLDFGQFQQALDACFHGPADPVPAGSAEHAELLTFVQKIHAMKAAAAAKAQQQGAGGASAGGAAAQHGDDAQLREQLGIPTTWDARFRINVSIVRGARDVDAIRRLSSSQQPHDGRDARAAHAGVRQGAPAPGRQSHRRPAAARRGRGPLLLLQGRAAAAPRQGRRGPRPLGAGPGPGPGSAGPGAGPAARRRQRAAADGHGRGGGLPGLPALVARLPPAPVRAATWVLVWPAFGRT